MKLNRYKFPSPVSEPNLAVDEYDSIMRTARRIQYEFDDLAASDLNQLAGALCYLREKSAWFIWPKEAPVKSPRKFLEVVTGESADKVIEALHTLAKNGVWHRIAWLADSKETDETTIRDEEIRRMNAEGFTQTEIGERVGLSRSRVSEVLSENRVITPKADTPRKTVGYRITAYTKPATAAEKIRATFGHEFAQALKAAL